jgi:hypothetical protein
MPREDSELVQLRAQLEALQADREQERADRIQERAEIALLRAQVAESQKQKLETAEEKRKHAEFLAWIALTAEQKTQLVADKKFKDMGGDLWQVSLKDQPTVRLLAHSEYEAIGRFNEVCGITGTEEKHTAVRVGANFTQGGLESKV